MKTFPKPLGAEEEQYYLQKYQQGDPEAKDLLIEKNLRLVAHIVKKYQHLDDDPEDLISIGTIGLIKAVSTYDQSKGSRLATYAARCIDNELLMFLRSKKKSSKEISLYEPIGTDKEGNELNLLDVIEHNTLSVTDKVNLKQDIEKLYEVLEKTLTPREKMVIELRYGLYNQKEKTQREIAEMLGISRSYVSRIEKNALAKLRKLLE
ncbi:MULTISPECIES: RNA polymerase sporulation sigma factor SigK [Diplocloster]|uniref:RNA polymerase sigma factor n=2 Tax=Diplocloster TaxID=2918511 RepID=A0A949K2X5_9FIRM|nr:RNA polymerase sporulation sigma factor SigK [Suonthocola fibrivorans]MBU9729043.1 RNA polymerase sporulation sigma factor SigK [Diplocloster modestus]MBU9738342.1 RNA polymerase sporulation sigma factor SigK [Diplocloster agilis]SCJ24811.1 RNA polymerase sigma-28 factor precursor [uncultured Clostridium sp.]MBU9745808.1 RNA polymerase sporulation sigma factor SigK [Diplocloster agilis]MCU6734130.1 RNA polymerase sporulation sigma factor SigK [Suonthocola fibrivorans]